MPDWITHILFSLILIRVAKLKTEKDIAILGSVLPDLDHILIWASPGTSIPLAFMVSGRFFHNILAIIGLSLILSSIFEKRYLWDFLAFSGLHLGLDMLFAKGVPLFYPFSSAWFSFNVFEIYTPWIPVVLSLIYSILFLYSRHHG